MTAGTVQDDDLWRFVSREEDAPAIRKHAGCATEGKCGQLPEKLLLCPSVPSPLGLRLIPQRLSFRVPEASSWPWAGEPRVWVPRNPDPTYAHHTPARRPQKPLAEKPQNLFVKVRPRLQKEAHSEQMETKFQPFYSKQLLTMYKYCILAHMKNTTSKAPRNVFIHVTGPFTKRVYNLL